MAGALAAKRRVPAGAGTLPTGTPMFGQHLGRIEAVGVGRDRVPRRVGVHSEGDGSRLRFFRLTGARLAGGRVLLAAGPSLDVLPGGAC